MFVMGLGNVYVHPSSFLLSESAMYNPLYNLDQNIVQRLEFLDHHIVNTMDRKPKQCVYCKAKNIRTKLGHRAFSRHKCSKCNVPLCTKNRYCFVLYHSEMLIQEIQQIPTF